MGLSGHFEDQECWIEELVENTSTEEEFIIDSILPSGLSVLIGAPKAGKTNFVKQAAVDIAIGRNFLGTFGCQAGKSFLALYESSRTDIAKSFAGVGIPPQSIRYNGEFIKADVGGLFTLENLIERGEFKLIVLDTFSIFKGSAKLNDYTRQYQAFEPLNRVAEETGTSLVVVTHTKQTAKRKDVGSAGYRTQGLRAVATSTLVLTRNHGDSTADLRIESRKASDKHLKLSFDQTRLMFEYRGEVDGNFVSDEMIRILKHLYHEGRPATPKDIEESTGIPHKSAYNILYKLVSMGYVCKPRHGLYMITLPGSIKVEQS